MPALTSGRTTPRRTGDLLTLPVAAAKVCWAGGLACRDGDGNATPGRGVAKAVTVEIEKGIFRFDNSSAADLIATADIGADCYVVDDQTVAKTNGGGQRSVAGKIFDVDAQGVWVDLR